MFYFEKPKIEIAEISEDNKYGRFVVEPLERGYGITLGNSLRRIMLSSLPGAAVSQVKIDGVLHEFSSIPGEDSGYYFPFHLTKTGSKMTFKKNGVPTKQGIAFDPDIIFRVTKDDTFEVLVDDSSVVKFNFAGATFES